jgi:hypothetical protein
MAVVAHPLRRSWMSGDVMVSTVTVPVIVVACSSRAIGRHGAEASTP